MATEIPRQHKRISIHLEIEMEAASGSREARISDLSLGGCYVDSIAPVRLDENVRFTIWLPGGRREKMSGDVIYIHEGIGFGLRFNNLTDDQRMILQQMILADGGTL